MEQNTVKKTADVFEKDKEFIEENIPNFSAFVRRSITRKKLHNMHDDKKKQLHQALETVVEHGTQAREEWREKQEELLEEFDAEIDKEDRQGIHFYFKEDEDKLYTVGWAGQEVRSLSDGALHEGEPHKLGTKLASQWLNTIDQYIEGVTENTPFNHVTSDEHSIYFTGVGEMERFQFITKYCPTEKEAVDIKIDGDHSFRPSMIWLPKTD